jgi:hypothetical protein
MKQYDLYSFWYTAKDADGEPIDFTNATSVTMSMYNDATSVKTVDCGVCEIVDPIGGVIQYKWKTGETDAIGMYRIEFRIIFWDESMLTLPTNDVIWLFIVPSVHGKVTP